MEEQLPALDGPLGSGWEVVLFPRVVVQIVSIIREGELYQVDVFEDPLSKSIHLSDPREVQGLVVFKAHCCPTSSLSFI